MSSINSAYVWKILAESVWPSGKNRGSHYQGQNSDSLNCPVTLGILYPLRALLYLPVKWGQSCMGLVVIRDNI